MNTSSTILTDKFGRQIDYLRIAVTDRCNLRCFYCMPEHGIEYLPKKELLTYEELLRLVHLFCELGVRKVRLTGGEPFVRKGILDFMRELRKIPGLEGLYVTTNGVLTTPYISDLSQLVSGVNLSLDSLDKENFKAITRRNEFDQVMESLDQLVAHDIPTKINMVVMAGKNEHEVTDMARLAQHRNLHVRFIEEMPFNGSDQQADQVWSHKDILADLVNTFPEIQKLSSDPRDPASLYQIPGHAGKIGIIPAFSRTFCGSCNRVRLTAVGAIKNCLYDDGVLDIRNLLRNGASDQEIKSILIATIKQKKKDGYEAEAARKLTKITESMSTIGG